MMKKIPERRRMSDHKEKMNRTNVKSAMNRTISKAIIATREHLVMSRNAVTMAMIIIISRDPSILI
jgi:hypothetical protein